MRWLWLLVLPALAAGLVAVTTLAAPNLPELPVAPLGQCGSGAQPIYTNSAANVIPTETGWRLGSEAVLELDACGPGRLTLKATGEVGGGSGPRLLVGMDDQDLLSEVITGPQEISVRVPKAGRVYLSYLNDYILQDERTAYLTGLRLGGMCNGLSGFLSQTPDQLRDPIRSASLYTKNTLTLRPCGPGELRFHAQAKAVNGVYPVLTISGATEDKLVLKAAEGDYRIAIQGETRITIGNPSYRLVEDRNLILENIKLN